jgi:drug/metabolite transporter (DMT)-like permease
MTGATETFRRYFGARNPPELGELEPVLWNEEVGTDQYAGDAVAYRAAILEQYKLYVEMADRISARRALANTFFVTLNTAVLTLIGALWKGHPHVAAGWLAIPFVILLGLCLAWFWMVRSYRQLNAGKYVVVGALERRLPASPYGSAEWSALGEGRDKARYWPLTHLEKWVPCVFAAAYLAGFIAAIAS